MNTLSGKSLTALLILLIFCKPLSAGKNNFQEKVMPVVSFSWLEKNFSDPDLIILHVSPVKPDYDNGHIPGARFLWPGYITISTEKETTVPAPAREVEKLLRSLGVNNNSHIVLCGVYGNIIPVARVFVTLEHYGLKGRVSILDGGFEAWKGAGLKVSTESPVVKKGNFTVKVVNNIVDGRFVSGNLTNKSYSIVDARPKSQYDGITGTPRPGHIPGAKNLPQTEMYDGKTYIFNDTEKIKQAFGKLEIPEGSRPVFYCHSGNQASVDYVAAIIAGFDPLIYDGSMEEWASRIDLPVEK